MLIDNAVCQCVGFIFAVSEIDDKNRLMDSPGKMNGRASECPGWIGGAMSACVGETPVSPLCIRPYQGS
jgi:hypothetical protein